MWDPRIIKTPFGHCFRPLKKTQLFCKSSDKSLERHCFHLEIKFALIPPYFPMPHSPSSGNPPHFLPSAACLNETWIVTYSKHRESSQSQAIRKDQRPRKRKTGQVNDQRHTWEGRKKRAQSLNLSITSAKFHTNLNFHSNVFLFYLAAPGPRCSM